MPLTKQTAFDMSKTLVIGATGKIGKILIRLLAQNTIPTKALVRDRQKCDFPSSVEIVEGDLESGIETTMEDCSTVIFTAGSGAKTGFDKTLLVDLWGARQAIEAAKISRIQHFIMISSRGAGDPDPGPERIKPYLVAKHFADKYLAESGLNYTILRPGRLTDDIGNKRIRTDRPEDPNKQFISREDTAHTILHCLKNNTVVGKTYELFEGSDSIEDLIV
ncbi:SDR family oxidoreductase [Puniceicoccaceae bacterium K14]|nr:SDR family oxidoreductase [Puniceicoccaceae bacterium K14]